MHKPVFAALYEAAQSVPVAGSLLLPSLNASINNGKAPLKAAVKSELDKTLPNCT